MKMRLALLLNVSLIGELHVRLIITLLHLLVHQNQKKEAKKNDAFDALVFIYQHVNQSTGYDPANKDFRLLFDLNKENPELKVFVID